MGTPRKRVITYSRKHVSRKAVNEVTLSPTDFDSSPPRTKEITGIDPQDGDKDLDVFGIKKDLKLGTSGVMNPLKTTRSMSSSPSKSSKSTPMSSPFKSSLSQKLSSKSNMGNMDYFIEAPMELRPQWSPKKTPASSPRRYENRHFLEDTLDTPTKSVISQDDYSASPTPTRVRKSLSLGEATSSVRKKLRFDFEDENPQKSPKFKCTPQENDAWNLFNQMDLEKSPRKKTTIDVISRLNDNLQEIRDSDHRPSDLVNPSSDLNVPDHIINVFESLSNDLSNSLSKASQEQASPVRLNNNLRERLAVDNETEAELFKKTYGVQRSYLAEIQKTDDEKEGPASPDGNSPVKEEEEEDNFSQLKNINDLRAFGKINEFADELDYLLEGLSFHDISVQRSTLLDLGLKMYESDKFSLQLKQIGLPDSLLKIGQVEHDELDLFSCFLLIFVIMKTLNKSQSLILLKFKNVLIALLENNESLEEKYFHQLTKISKLNLHEFLDRFLGELGVPFNERNTKDVTPSLLALYCIHELYANKINRNQILISLLNDYSIISGLNSSIYYSIDLSSNLFRQQEKLGYTRLLFFIPLLEYCFSDSISLPESDRHLQQNLKSIIGLIKAESSCEKSEVQINCIILILRLSVLMSSQSVFRKGSVLYDILYDPSLIHHALNIVSQSSLLKSYKGTSNEKNMALFASGFLVNLIDEKGECREYFYNEQVISTLKSIADTLQFGKTKIDEELHFNGYLCFLVGLLKFYCNDNKKKVVVDTAFSCNDFDKISKGLVSFSGIINDELGGGIKGHIDEVLRFLN